MIGIVYSGAGNIGSLVRILKEIGVNFIVVNNINDLNIVEKLILPGVGSFDSAIMSLKNSGMWDVLRRKVIEDRVPILGICLGMQLLFCSSEEGELQGLGFIDGVVKKLTRKEGYKLPHVGWNNVIIKKDSPLFHRISEDSFFYFTHNYGCYCNNYDDILCTSGYSDIFVSSVNRENIFGVQFHPEKSHSSGFQLIKNFIDI
jgi:glutamine amidotransferase